VTAVGCQLIGRVCSEAAEALGVALDRHIARIHGEAEGQLRVSTQPQQRTHTLHRALPNGEVQRRGPTRAIFAALAPARRMLAEEVVCNALEHCLENPRVSAVH
jgi:hypothetical protein